VIGDRRATSGSRLGSYRETARRRRFSFAALKIWKRKLGKVRAADLAGTGSETHFFCRSSAAIDLHAGSCRKGMKILLK
jgi:hypothetical protein